MDLNNFSTNELLNEIEKRKKQEKQIPEFLSDEKIISKIPEIKQFLLHNFRETINNGYEDDDFEHYCFEYIIEMFFGDIWNWYNELLI